MAASTEISGSGIREGGEILGRLVAVRRAGLGLSQEDLAARMDRSESDVARIEEGRLPSTETLQRLEAALCSEEPGTGVLWSSLGRRWLWGSLAIAILVPALVIAGWRSSGTDDVDSSHQLPPAVSAAPAAPPVGVEAQENAQKAETAAPQQDRAKRAHREAPGDSRSRFEVQRQPAGEEAPVRTPRPKPAPAPPVSPAPPQPPSPGSSSAPPQTTGKPVGSPGNGPGGGNGPGAGTGSGGGNGPGGAGPPGQMR